MTRLHAIFCLVALNVLVPSIAFAQESLSVTVTPPMIQLTIGQGEVWASSLKIVNANPFDLTYYATPVDFEADGEEGKGTFMPLLASDHASLGNWVEISRDPILVPRGESKEVPFAVRIPADAPPGGHYAAILIGTTPEDAAVDGPTVKVSSYVSSLLFVRIKGDIDERARIREFRTEKWLYQDPKATFLLRFENLGNTHLRPQGEIVLYNMWGKERGRVQLNQKSAFGNVLPASIRRFSFLWAGEESLFDIGRYSAVVTLSYGEDQKQNVSAATYFWVVPVVPVAVTLGATLAFILLILWLLRRYIHRALMLERERFGLPTGAPLTQATMGALLRPFHVGAVDLRNATGRQSLHGIDVEQAPERPTFIGFLKEYSLFFFFVALLAAGGFWLWMYFDSVLVSERDYEISDVSTGEEVSTE